MLRPCLVQCVVLCLELRFFSPNPRFLIQICTLITTSKAQFSQKRGLFLLDNCSLPGNNRCLGVLCGEITASNYIRGVVSTFVVDK